VAHFVVMHNLGNSPIVCVHCRKLCLCVTCCRVYCSSVNKCFLCFISGATMSRELETGSVSGLFLVVCYVLSCLCLRMNKGTFIIDELMICVLRFFFVFLSKYCLFFCANCFDLLILVSRMVVFLFVFFAFKLLVHTHP